jgi:integrase
LFRRTSTELLGGLGLHLGLLRIIEDVTLRFPSHLDAGFVVLDVSCRVTRIGTIAPDDFAGIVAHMKRPAQRYLIALYETSMRLNEPMKLKWDMVDLKTGLLRLPAEIVKEKYPRRTPISWELREVLEELRAEQRKLPNLGGYVFSRKERPADNEHSNRVRKGAPGSETRSRYLP